MYRKETFVQANYRFLLSPGDHTRSMVDSDHPIDWDAVQLVMLASDTPPHCPICLETPVAAKVTKCGHVFCFPCILHYLGVGAAGVNVKTWKRCPLCFESIYSKSLKSFEISVHPKYRPGDVMDFVMLNRFKVTVRSFFSFFMGY
jgi:hypothetical protein